MGPEHPLCLAMLSHQARARLQSGDGAGAAASAAELVSRAGRALPEQDPAQADYRRLWGEALLQSGDAAEAERVLRETFDMLDDGTEPERRTKTAALLAEACEALGRSDDAARWRVVAEAPAGEPVASGG
jgi:hypothetical protein